MEPPSKSSPVQQFFWTDHSQQGWYINMVMAYFILWSQPLKVDNLNYTEFLCWRSSLTYSNNTSSAVSHATTEVDDIYLSSTCRDRRIPLVIGHKKSISIPVSIYRASFTNVCVEMFRFPAKNKCVCAKWIMNPTYRPLLFSPPSVCLWLRLVLNTKACARILATPPFLQISNESQICASNVCSLSTYLRVRTVREWGLLSLKYRCAPASSVPRVSVLKGWWDRFQEKPQPQNYQDASFPE